MFKLFKKEKIEIKYEMPREYILTRPIPQAESRGVTEKFIQVSMNGKVKDFMVGDPVFVQVLNQLKGIEHFDMSLGKKVRRMVKPGVS